MSIQNGLTEFYSIYFTPLLQAKGELVFHSTPVLIYVLEKLKYHDILETTQTLPRISSELEELPSSSLLQKPTFQSELNNEESHIRDLVLGET